MTSYTHKITGCLPTPLASYLKALGILRLVAEQVDSSAQGWWEGDVFHLQTSLDANQLQNFFLNDYCPTPVVAPWNGGSGFYPKDNQAAIKQISAGGADRFGTYRETILACQSTIAALKLKEKPDGEAKEQMLVACRGRLPDAAIEWLDAAYVLTADGPKYPPLLGTGGNDGRLEFTNNLMQRLVDLIDTTTGSPTPLAASWWDEAFFPTAKHDLQKDSILGQFDPGAFDRSVNPWDFVLMIEGTLIFASAAVKRHETAAKGTLSYPFCVRSAGIGYGSSASTDEDSCRAEIWLPTWRNPCGLAELANLFAEGRAQVHGRPARNGVDFARAVSTLGIDRGISEFIRYGFHARNGLAYFAVPLGRFEVRSQPQVNLLQEIDTWLDSFRRAASSDNAPSSARRALNRLEDAIVKLCQRRGAFQLQSVLIALGEAERILSKSPKWREEAYQRPIPLLRLDWLESCDDGTPEFRLAASLAAIDSRAVGSFRQHLEPVEVRSTSAFWSDSSSAFCNVVWGEGDLETNLAAVFRRRCIQAVVENERASDGTLIFPGHSRCVATLADIAKFLSQEIDDQRVSQLVRGLNLLNWKQAQVNCRLRQGPQTSRPDAAYTLLKLCFLSYESGHLPREFRQTQIPLTPEIARLAVAGRLDAAGKLAARRLVGSGVQPLINNAARQGKSAKRIAASLIFPISPDDMQDLARSVLVPVSQTV
jgi:CRISPR-associated protein Csx17